KSALKMTKTRIEMVRRKRNAMQKYLKNDIADLLKNGLDVNAYSRDFSKAEGLLVELNLSSCYEDIEQFCSCISSHLSTMNKQRECPEECREAVPSLMFAAARFADLPELRDLRNIFTEKYGKSLEPYVNQELVQKLKSAPPTKDMKLQLMQDIAQELGIDWDSKALEQKLYKPPIPEQDLFRKTSDIKRQLQERKDESVPKIEKWDAGYNRRNGKELTGKGRTQEHLSSHGREEIPYDDGQKPHKLGENAVLDGDDQRHDLSRKTHNKTRSTDIHVVSHEKNSLPDYANSVKRASKEEIDDKQHFGYRSIPPPYTIPSVSKYETSLEEVPPIGSGAEKMGLENSNDHLDGEDNHHADELATDAKPVPRSVRRQRLKPPPGQADIDKGDGRRKSTREKKQDDARQGLKVFANDAHNPEDEEERMIDDLLIRYSKKEAPSEPVKEESALKPPPSRQDVVNPGKATRHRSHDGVPPSRATSLPPEPTSPSEGTKGHARASSLQPEMLNPSGHVHPNLPDYDDFLARFAALRGK
ncbi:hypothetical protein RJ639_037808, partial [Escallonia herrerae]